LQRSVLSPTAMGEFGFLSSAWGIDLSEASKNEITEQAYSLGRRDVEEYIKDSDLRKLKHTSSLPKEITRISAGVIPPGQYLVQIQKVADITQPTKFQEEFEGGKWRLLTLDLAAGDQKFKAIEFQAVKDLGVQLPPGTKLLLYSTEKANLRVQNGHLLLVPQAVEVLGGYVETLVASWKADREIKETRLLWRTDGIKKSGDGEGAPRWVDFDPKKAPRGTAHRKQMEEERSEWRKGKAVVSAPDKTNGADAGPRFQKEDFDADSAKQVKTQVSSNAFAQDQSSKKGKGEGKGKGKGDDGPPRRGKGGRDDDQEEKRAPTQATSSLAAFIKPTKNGELPEAAAKLLTAPAEETWEGDWDEGWGGTWDDGSWGAGWQTGTSWGGGGGGKSRGKKGGGSRKGGGGGKKGGGGKRR